MQFKCCGRSERIFLTTLILMLVLVLGTGLTRAQSAPPRIFFTDLTSGPNTGGENNNGTILTIYGKGFGSSQGNSTVTIGGGAAAAYLQWGAAAPGETGTQKISVALGPAAASGNVVVTVGGQASNGVPFTVRPGNIRCVSTTGNDSNSGNFPTQCWATPRRAVDAMGPGDISYVLNGVSQNGIDGCPLSGTPVLCFQPSNGFTVTGTAANPIAIVAYPGATVTINGNEAAQNGIRMADNPNFWVIAGLTIHGGSFGSAVTIDLLADHVRFIGNEMTCPRGDGATACFETSVGTNIKFLGNFLHDAGVSNASKLYHGVYFSTESDGIEAGWNTIRNVRGCRGLQFHSSPLDATYTGRNQFDLHVHDNVIHDTRCDGINFATVSPQLGVVEAYNNIVYNAGTGPDSVDGSSDYACIFSGDATNSGTPGTGNIEIYNNTLYNCGSRGGANQAGCYVKDGSNQNLYMRLRNNICSQLSGENYVDSGFTGQIFLDRIIGTNNLWFGLGNGPSWITANVNSDPKLAGVVSSDFHLLTGSPAIGAGVTIAGLFTDFDGVPRPQGPAFAIGAYEFNTGTPPPPSAPVINSALTASGTAGTAFSYQITASNSPTSFSAAPLPVGLSVNTSNGLISGTPTVAGTSSVILSATNAGGTGTATLTLTVNNPAPPAVSITPLSTTTLSGTVTLTASASSNLGIASVQFLLDGNNLGSSVAAPPFTLSWNTAQAAPGTHSLTAVATDTSGNKTTAAPITVTVVRGADATPGLRSAIVYPNPAVKTDPTIRAFLGVVSSVEITIFDASGRVVHSSTLAGVPTGILNGQYYYDYKWTGSKSSGVYFAVIHGKAADGTIIRARTRFAVIQ